MQLFFVLIVVFFFLMIVLVIVSAEQAKARSNELAALAQRLQLSFVPDNQRDFAKRYPQIKFLHQGQNHYAYNFLSGAWREHFVYIFDYHWSTETTVGDQSSTSHHAATFILMEPVFSMQPFVMRPEGIFDRIAEFFGSQSIDFESAAFSSEFHVNSPNRRWTHDFFHSRMIEYIMENEMREIICDGKTIAADWENKQLSPSEIERSLQRLAGLLALMPGHFRGEKVD